VAPDDEQLALALQSGTQPPTREATHVDDAKLSPPGSGPASRQLTAAGFRRLQTVRAAGYELGRMPTRTKTLTSRVGAAWPCASRT
jgi:hypothetical protein